MVSDCKSQVGRVSYVATTTYRPINGERHILLPAGCTRVLFAFDKVEQAVRFAAGGEVMRFHCTSPDAARFRVRADTGEASELDEAPND